MHLRYRVLAPSILSAGLVLSCSTADRTTDDDASAHSEQATWTVNDVSYLFPLTGGDPEEDLLAVDAMGRGGALLPENAFREHIGEPLGGLFEGFGREMSYGQSRVVAMRIDPCGRPEPHGGTPAPPRACEPQLRLTTQPFLDGEDVDAALHLVYALDPGDFEALILDLLALRGDDPLAVDAPLGPHPRMVAEGLRGPFATGLKRIITTYAGASNLTHWTAMTRGRNSTNWRFSKFTRQGGRFAPAAIPGLCLNSDPECSATVQGVHEEGRPGPNEFPHRRSTLISPASDAGFPTELLDSEGAAALAPEAWEAALLRLAELEDPARTSNADTDCASCHVTGNALPFYAAVRGVPSPSTFEAPAHQNVERFDETGLDPRSMRAFGYFSGRVAISQRTVNESALVASTLTAMPNTCATPGEARCAGHHVRTCSVAGQWETTATCTDAEQCSEGLCELSPYSSTALIDLGTLPGGSETTFELGDGALGFGLQLRAPALQGFGIEDLSNPDGVPVITSHVPASSPNAAPRTLGHAGFASAIVPGNDPQAVRPGTWTLRTSGTESTRGRVAVQRTDDGLFHGGDLDLHIYIPDGLEIHDPTPRHPVTADDAPSDEAVQRRLDTFFFGLETLFGVGRGQVFFHEIGSNYLEAGDQAALDELMRQSVATVHPGLHLFMVQRLAIEPTGQIWGVASRVAGDPVTAGTAQSGIALSLLDMFSATADGWVMLHELGHFLGLPHTSEPQGWNDFLVDTPSCPSITTDEAGCPDRNNLMFPSFWRWTGGQGIVVSPNQRRIVQASPIYRAFRNASVAPSRGRLAPPPASPFGGPDALSLPCGHTH